MPMSSKSSAQHSVPAKAAVNGLRHPGAGVKKAGYPSKVIHVPEHTIPKQLSVGKVVTLQHMVSLIAPLVSKRKLLELEKSAFDQKYQLVDGKGVSSPSSVDLSLSVVNGEIRELRAIARAGFGFKPMRLTLFSTFYYNTTGAGLVASAIALDPSGLSEFSSAAALFDEYKVHSCKYTYNCMSYMLNAGTSLNSFGVVAYDPTDGTAPASLISLTQLQQHQLYFKTVLVAATTNPFTRHTHQVFDCRVPPGVLTSVGAAATTGTSNWQPTGVASPQPYGFLKAYFDGLQASASGLSGLLVYHTEFRCRE